MFGQLEINIEELVVSDPWLLSLLLVDYKANNPDAVCSRWWRHPCFTANEEHASLNVIVTVGCGIGVELSWC